MTRATLVQRVAWAARGRLAFAKVQRKGRVLLAGAIDLDLRGEVTLGRSVMFFGGLMRTSVRVHPRGVLVVGDHSVFSSGSRYDVSHRLTIGKRCIFASQVTICDRVNGRQAPITLGNDIWVAHGATILPGVTIGDGAVIAAGSVVGKDVPARHMAVGNPARAVIMSLARDR